MAKVPTTTKSSRADDRRRGARVGQRVREELTLILAQDVGDPRAQGVVISGVDVTDDVSLARVSFVVMGDTPDGAKAAAALKVLKRLTATLRTKLAPRCTPWTTPLVVRDNRDELQGVLLKLA